MTERVSMTEAAADMLRTLRDRHGPLLIHQSGGCCDGSAPMCLTIAEFRVPETDVRLGTLELGPAPSGEGSAGDTVTVWVDAAEYRVWERSRLLLDLVPGRAAGFSLEGSDRMRFVSRVQIDPDGIDSLASPPAGADSLASPPAGTAP
jgi:uncharacterized protein (DUF779 family)